MVSGIFCNLYCLYTCIVMAVYIWGGTALACLLLFLVFGISTSVPHAYIKAVAQSLASYLLKVNQLPLQEVPNSPTL